MSSPVSKKRRVFQTFRAEYTVEWPCVIKSRLGPNHAFCTICSTDISIGHSGRFDIKTHIGSVKHKSRAETVKQKSILDMFSAKTSVEEGHSKKVMHAEALMVDFIAQHNLSFAVADSLPALIRSMCPDSAIAKDLKCARSKASALAKEMSEAAKESLVARMRTGPFTISTDGSNDMEKGKLFPLVVRTVSDEGVKSEVLSVPELHGSATGERIFECVNNIMQTKEIPWTNCLSLGSDNANVMTGKNKGVISFCKEKHPNMYLSGCTLHLVHIAAEKGAKVLPVDPGDILTDIYFYFNKSALRSSRFHELQDFHNKDQLKILKHVATRWLSIGKCLDRLLVNWEPLKSFFKEEVANKNLALTAKSKATKILDSLKSRSTRLYIMFLSYNTKVFETFLTANQSDNPKAHRMQSDCRKLIRNVQTRFVAPSAFAQGKLIEDVDYKSSYNHKDNKNIMIGEDAREFIANKAKNGLTDAKIAEFFTNVKLYFTTCTDYMLKNLPISDPLLKHIEIADPDLISHSNLDSVRYLAQRYPILLSGCTTDTLLEEFSSLQCFALQLQDPEPTTAEQFWLKLSKTNDSLEQSYKHIATFMLGLLTIPHSSAHCERVFSAVRKIKTDIRSSISAPTLEAILVLKHRKTVLLSLKEPQLLERLKKAYTLSIA